MAVRQAGFEVAAVQSGKLVSVGLLESSVWLV